MVERKQTKLWTCQDNRRVRICDMSDSHLTNAIKYLQRKANVLGAQAILTGYEALSMLQGEIAVLTMEREIENLEENGMDPCEVNPLYDNLIEDAWRRGLEL